MNNINPINFKGKYQINANQEMPSKEACLKRDFSLGFWMEKANNGQALQEKFQAFIANDYKKNKTAPCNLIYELDDKFDTDFEESMKLVGQNFSKLA